MLYSHSYALKKHVMWTKPKASRRTVKRLFSWDQWEWENEKLYQEGTNVSDLVARLTTLEEVESDHADIITTLKQEVTQLKQDLTEMEQENEDLEARSWLCKDKERREKGKRKSDQTATDQRFIHDTLTCLLAFAIFGALVLVFSRQPSLTVLILGTAEFH